MKLPQGNWLLGLVIAVLAVLVVVAALAFQHGGTKTTATTAEQASTLSAAASTGTTTETAIRFEPLSQLAGSDGFVLENVAEAIDYGAEVVFVRGGKIVADYIYHDDLQQEPPMQAPTPLQTPPAASDTEAASAAVAKAYMAALRALDPARLASLYAPEVVYMDTGRDVDYRGPSAAVRAHVRMFALKGVRFRANGVLVGPGWAAVMWKRRDREGGKSLVDIPAQFTRWGERPTIHGVSVLEIRDGKIARETIYCDHLRTKY
jgi:ketosteroid isomerase-like protein